MKDKFKKIELAWAAGFFDGEGCFHYSKKQGRVQISLSQTAKEPLERFKDAVETGCRFSIGSIYGPFEYSNMSGWKPQWVYRCNSFEDTQYVIAVLWKYMCSIKKDQAYRVLKDHRDADRVRIKRLTNAECLAIEECLRAGVKGTEIAKRFNRSKGSISLYKTRWLRTGSVA